MADDEQFSLCWNNFNSNLSAGFHESLCRGDLVDVTLAAEGQLVKAHRLVLSVCSPYFRKMFTQMPANQHAFVFLKDVSHAALKDLIQFMYCGEVNVKQDALPAFISTAEALQIKGLTETGETPVAPQTPLHQPAPPSPVKEMPPLVASTPITIVHQTSPRQQQQQRMPQRSRVQSYKMDSEGSSDEKVIIHQQQVSQKRAAPKSLTPVSAPAIKRAKQVQQQQQIIHQTAKSSSDPLEAPTPIQIITSQASSTTSSTHHVMDNKSISGDTEFIDLPIETINPKSEPEYEEPEEEPEQHEQHEQIHELDQESENEQEQQYAEENQSTYGEIKYDESYFTNTEQPSEEKAGVSGMSISGVNESYATEGEPSTTEAQVHPVILQRTPISNKFQILDMKILNLPKTSPPVMFARNANLNSIETYADETIQKTLSSIKIEPANKGRKTIELPFKPAKTVQKAPQRSSAVNQLERLMTEDDDSMDSLTSEEEVIDPLAGPSSSSSTLFRVDYEKIKQEQCTSQLDQLLTTVRTSSNKFPTAPKKLLRMPANKINLPSPVQDQKILNFTKPMPITKMKTEPQSSSNIIRIDYGKAEAGPSLARTVVAPAKPRITQRTKTVAPPVRKEAMVPIHEGSDVLVPRNLLMKAFSKKPAQYALRLAQILFGSVELEKAARENDIDDVFCTLDQKKLKALTTHIVQIYRKQTKPIVLTPGMIINTLRSKLLTIKLQQRAQLEN